jgi:LmbE family N-acetylglucosaminyl deacetylase
VVDEQVQQVQRVLAAAAHPDDVAFGSGGTIATRTDAGLDVSYCIVTDGDARWFRPRCARSAIGSIRQEQRKAAPRWAAPTSSSSATPTAGWR